VVSRVSAWLLAAALAAAPARAMWTREFGAGAARAQAALDAGDFARAEEAAAALPIDDAAPREDRADMLFKRADLLEKARSYVFAERDLRAAAALTSRRFEALRLLAQFLRERRRLDEALAYGDELAALTGLRPADESEALLQRAETLMGLGRNSEAEADVERALRANPGDHSSLWLKVQIRMRERRFPEALSAADEMLAAAKTSAERGRALAQRAQIRRGLGDANGARADARAAAKEAPDDSAVLEAVLETLSGAGERGEARAVADRMVAVGGSPIRKAVVLAERAELRKDAGDLRGAEQDLREAYAGYPEDLTTLAGLASLMIDEGRLAEADLWSQRLSSASARMGASFQGDADLIAARVRQAQGRTEESDALRRRAAELSADARQRLGEIALQEKTRGEVSAADAAREAAASLRRELAAEPDKAKAAARLLALRDAAAGCAARAEFGAAAAEAFWSLGRGAEAVRTMAAALAADPEAACRGEVPLLRDRSAAADEYLSACVKRFPTDAGLLSDRGIERGLRGAAAAGEADLRAALSASPGSLSAALSLASILDGAGRRAEAETVLAQALARTTETGSAAAAARDELARLRPSATDYGILLLAHGGEPDWNAQIEDLRAKADRKIPTEAALGMADPEAIQTALDKLAARGVKRVVGVPLFVHSRSEVIDQTRYVLGLADKPSEILRVAAERMAAAHAGEMRDAPAGDPAMAAHMHMHMHMFSLERAKTALPVSLAPGLDAAPLVSRILLERARALSRDPRSETVVLVAHGPVDDAAVGAWEEALAVHAAFVRREGGFRGASGAILRDDAVPEVRARAVAALRGRVAAAAKAGRAIVVPVLIARGGIETKIPRDLAGLDFAWDGATLMPHDGFADWVLESAAKAAAAR